MILDCRLGQPAGTVWTACRSTGVEVNCRLTLLAPRPTIVMRHCRFRRRPWLVALQSRRCRRIRSHGGCDDAAAAHLSDPSHWIWRYNEPPKSCRYTALSMPYPAGIYRGTSHEVSRRSLGHASKSRRMRFVQFASRDLTKSLFGISFSHIPPRSTKTSGAIVGSPTNKALTKLARHDSGLENPSTLARLKESSF
jgi:hypothetical protein